MHSRQPATLIRYYKNFGSVSGALAIATGVGPLISALNLGGLSPYLFPPLGETTVPSRLGIVMLAIATTYLAYYARVPTAPFTRLFPLLALSMLFLCAYIVSFGHFVRKIDIPATNSSIFVTVGYERTASATKTFDSESDWDMLRARGTSDEELEKLWTEHSLDMSHLCLLLTYSGFVLPLVLVFSLGVRYQT